MVDIRCARSEDLNLIGQINLVSMQNTYHGIVSHSELSKITLETRISRLGEWFESKVSPRCIFLAYKGETPVGYSACAHKRYQHFEAELRSFHVLPDYQGQGIGSCLFDHTCSWLIQSDVHSLFVEVLRENPYRSFYEKKGGRFQSEYTQNYYGSDLEVVVYGWTDIGK